LIVEDWKSSAGSFCSEFAGIGGEEEVLDSSGVKVVKREWREREREEGKKGDCIVLYCVCLGMNKLR
jgi:hypothetical protein